MISSGGRPRRDLFLGRVTDYRTVVRSCSAGDIERAIEQALDGRTAVVPGGLPWRGSGSVLDNGRSARDLDQIDTVVTTATVAIAETGTNVLDHGPGQGRRALSLVPNLHVCVVRTDQIVASVPEAVSRLRPNGVQTWISGPSATSDIELERVEGVHGPRALHVIVIDV